MALNLRLSDGFAPSRQSVSLAPSNTFGSQADAAQSNFNGTYGDNTYNQIVGPGQQLTTPYTPAPATFTPNNPGAISGGAGTAATGGGGGSVGFTPPTPPDFSQLASTDSGFMTAAQAYNDKVRNFLSQANNTIGGANIHENHVNGLDPSSIQSTYSLGFSAPDGTKNLNPFAHMELGQNGNNSHFKSDNVLGGTMGADYNRALAGLDLSRTQGLTNLNEDYAARGLGFSGLLGKQFGIDNQGYQNQYDNLNSGVYNQANDLVHQLADQATQSQQGIAAARSDAAARLAASYNSVPAFSGG